MRLVLIFLGPPLMIALMVSGSHGLNLLCFTSPVPAVTASTRVLSRHPQKGDATRKNFTLQFGACQSIISLAIRNFKFESVYSLPIPAFCPNRRYLVEICIERGERYFINYKRFSFHWGKKGRTRDGPALIFTHRLSFFSLFSFLFFRSLAQLIKKFNGNFIA